MESDMRAITIENLRNDPELLDELRRRAHHARARAAHELLAAIVTRLKWMLQEIRSTHVSGRPAQG